MSKEKLSWWGLAVVLMGYLLLVLAFSQITPFNKGPDEGYHLEYITFIKQQGRLPISYDERAQITRADFPPLYHLLVSLLSAGVDVSGPPHIKIFWDSFRYRAMDHQADSIWYIQTEDYQWPYFGPFLVWQIGRWLSIALSLGTIVVVYLTLKETPLGQIPLAPLAGAGLLAFIPQYIFLSASLNDDNLLGLVAALYFWALVKAINRPRRWMPFVAMGLLIGVSLTVKYTLVIIPLELALVCWLLAQKLNQGWGWIVRRLLVVAALALLCAGWWFGWNLWFLNTVDEHGWLVGLLNPLLAGGADTTLNRLSGFVSGGQVGLTDLPGDTRVGSWWRWVQLTAITFWGVGVGDVLPGWPYAYLMVGLLAAVAGYGLGRVWQRNPAARPWLGLMLLHVVIFLVLPVVRFELTRRLGVAAQGRHILIPAAPAVAGLLVWGVAAMTSPRWHRTAFAAMITTLVIWSLAHLYWLQRLTASPLPLRTAPQAATWLARPAQATFDESLELVSFQIDPQPAQGRLSVELAWQTLAAVSQNYRLLVNLVDAQGRVVSHWTGYNGQGRLPTLAWEAGDVIFDRLALPLPNLPPGEYQVQAQLLGRDGPLPVSGSNLLELAGVGLDEPAKLDLPYSLSFAGASENALFALWQAGGPAGAEPVYRYPSTITVVTAQADVVLDLLDESGQSWPVAGQSANVFTFIIGPNWSGGNYRLRVTLADGRQAVSEPLLRVDNWWPRRFAAPAIQVPVSANFAREILLLGYKLPNRQVKAGHALPITLYWQAPPHRSPQADFIQFNHLLGPDGQLRGGYDRRPLEYYSTLLWAPGEVVVDGYTVPVDPDAPPGQYWLDVGYYITVGQSAVNLPLLVDGEMSPKTSVTIGPIEVVAP